MDSGEFWRLTSAELEALIEADAERLKEQREMAALPASTLLNLHRKPGAKSMQPLEFWEPATPQETPDQIVAMLELANARRESMRSANG
jgi:hypothetical protein